MPDARVEGSGRYGGLGARVTSPTSYGTSKGNGYMGAGSYGDTTANAFQSSFNTYMRTGSNEQANQAYRRATGMASATPAQTPTARRIPAKPNFGLSAFTYADPTVYANADASVGDALASQQFAQGQYAVKDEEARRNIAAANRQAQLDQAKLGIDNESAARRQQYLTDLYNIQNGMGLLDYADIAVDEGAQMRQYGLIEAERGRARGAMDRARDEYGRGVQRITEQEAAAKRSEKVDQQKMIAKAAAQGNVGLINTLDSKQLRAGLQDQLSEYTRNRAERRAQLEADTDEYFRAMNELNEREAATNDARERLKIQRERERLEQEQRNREYKEQQAQIQDENRRRFIEAAMIEEGRRKAESDAQLMRFYAGLSQADAVARYAAAVNAANAARTAETQRAWGEAQKNPIRQAPRSPGLGNLLGAGAGR